MPMRSAWAQWGRYDPLPAEPRRGGEWWRVPLVAVGVVLGVVALGLLVGGR